MRVCALTLEHELLSPLLLPSRSASDEENARECAWPRERTGPAGESDRMRIGADAACGGGGGGVSLLKARSCDEG